MSVPTPTTPKDLIELALKISNVLGVGQTARAEDVNDCFNLLNMMLAQWQTDRLTVYNLTTTSLTATGALSYTVGPGGDFDIPWVQRLESAYFTQLDGTSQPVSFPLRIMHAKEDYNRIAIKNLSSFPAFAFLDTAYPLSNLFVWPVPNNQYGIHITTLGTLQEFTDSAQQIILPPAYKAAMMWNLAIEIGPLFGLDPNVVTVAKAKTTLNALRLQNNQIPLMRMPSSVQSNTGTYNIYGDTYVGGIG